MSESTEFYTDFIPHDCSIPATEMVHRMQNGIKTFKEIINQNSNNKQLLLTPANWMIIIDYMYQNCSFTQHQHQDQLNLLDQLKQLAANSKLSDDKYRIIKQQDLLAMVKQAPGFQEFVKALGFKDGIYDNRLIMTEMDRSKINVAIFVIENKIKQIHKYEELCKIWQTCMRIMLEHKVFKTQTILKKLIKLDFVVNYNEYYNILKKLIAISNVKIYSEDGLVVEMMTNLGFTITHLGSDIQSQKVFTYMKLIYNRFKTIESGKKHLKLNDYYRGINKTGFYDSKEDKYDDDNNENRKYCLTVTEVENRRKTGIQHFEEILNSTSSDREMYLLNPLNWDILLDAICFNMKPSDNKAKRLEKLKIITQKAWHDDKYRIINLNHKTAKKNIVNIHGALVFLRGVGFKENILKNSIIFGNDSTLITEVAINAIIYKIKMVTKTQHLQSTWEQTLKIMLKHSSFIADTDKLDTLCSINLHLNYENYHEILTKVLKVKQQQNEKTSALEFLKELGLDIGMGVMIDPELSTKIFHFLRSIYTQINEIELDKQNHVQQMNNLVPSMERIITMPQALQTPGFDLDRRPTLTSAEIMDNIFAFGRNWNDKIDKTNQLLDDNELAKLYEMDDIKNLENEMLTKVFELQNEMHASSFQMEEYLRYIEHFRETKRKMKSKTCEDKHCKWDKNTVELWSLNQRQIVHIMFYHTKDYNEIATSESRASRFRQEPMGRIRKDQQSRPKTCTRRYETPMGDYKMDDFDEKESQQLEPGALCPKGNNCQTLSVLLGRCSNVNEFNSGIINIGDECKHEIDHCLDYHANFKGYCIYENNCNFKQKLKDCNNNRFVQLHAHFFHGIGIDSDEKTLQQKKRINNDERIQYKFALDSADENNNSFGILEFGKPWEINNKSKAQFKNPKDEMLKNSFHALSKIEWNELLRKSVTFAKSRNARKSLLNVKEIVSLKLYTDFDHLQREFRMCFRDNDPNERKRRQKQFYFWNNLIQLACKKSKDAISTKLYHGINDNTLVSACFSGTYYGPVSTTTDIKVARGFAGDRGQILELYPSFGARGLTVSWLSNFPDENEVLYMNVSFQISNIVKVNDDIIDDESFQHDRIIRGGMVSKSNMEYCILRALQTINIDARIISLNDKHKKDDENKNDFSNFDKLQNYEKLSVLYLLYLQYRPNEWKKLISNQNFLSNAFMKFRDQFISLAQNVCAVEMDGMSKLLQIFFYSQSTEYKLPILGTDQDFTAISQELERKYKPNKPFYFATIVKLFPSAQQIAISAANFDWSLQRFIDFLNVYDFEFHKIELQDIYIRHITKQDAKKNFQSNKSRDNIYTLKKLGWTFVTPIHLHRVGLQPLPELPFLLTFHDYNKKESDNAVRMFRSHSQFIMIDQNITPGGDEMDNKSDEKDEYKDEDIQNEGNKQIKQYVLVDHNPSNCILSKHIFNTLEYRKKLVEMLKWRKINWNKKVNYKSSLIAPGNNINDNNRFEYKFVNGCEKVESLVLNSIPNELYPIFYDINKSKAIISFESVIKIFPNLTDLFIRDTTFKLRECYKFINFINGYKQTNKLKLERVFFSMQHKIKDSHVTKVKLRLKEIGWNWIHSQQMIGKIQT